MRARVAYISSLGTTAILVAAALLMLAVVGALVAFRGWPGSANGAVIQPVPLGPETGAAQTVLVRPAAATRPVVLVHRTAARATAPARLSTAGLVKQTKAAVVPGIVMDPVAPASMHPAAPQTVAASPPTGAPAPIGAPQKPPSTPPTPAPVGTGNAPLPLPPPPEPLVPGGSPQAPSSDQVAVMVGELVAPPPPPVIGSVVDTLR